MHPESDLPTVAVDVSIASQKLMRTRKMENEGPRYTVQFVHWDHIHADTLEGVFRQVYKAPCYNCSRHRHSPQPSVQAATTG
ncbi:hypothetical protein EGR_09438 [Echinococcus granulosus]|uniref:Uncharacterized protein n=1 Tax=Echinococcus granulosus TaxID=6210 RepID=W6U3J2_ECHGR|nr:hypothetical protein EGR_09438 [Echinococcus granulosus]EUB55678.1 hypothetical protein EGR_09438 [Echinococcus granulosus]